MILPAIEDLLPPIGIDPIPFRNYVLKMAGLLEYATTSKA